MSEIERLRQIMARLRAPGGCPWDREQTLESLRTYLLEETYEVLEAGAGGSAEALREELGDLLLQIVFQAQIAEERGDFDLEAVAKGIGDKIIRRHPHVFGEARLDTADEVLAQWEQLKVEERGRQRRASVFSGVPSTLPALLKALRLSSKAARLGFDWPDAESLLAKVEEELRELHQAVTTHDHRAIAEELGDLLFTVVNVARQADMDPEQVLQSANRKFVERFGYVERRLREEGLLPSPENRERMEALWREAKALIGGTSPGRTPPSGGTSGNGPRGARRERAS